MYAQQQAYGERTSAIANACGPVTPQASIIREQCCGIAHATEILHKGLNELADRLQPVLGHELPCDPCSPGKDIQSLPPLAEELRSAAQSIQRANDLIARLHQRLAI